VNRIASGTNLPQQDGPRAERPVPRWAERLAHAIPLLFLPSGLWRLAVAFGFPMGMLNDAGELAVVRGWPAIDIAVISLLSEAVALTAFGLVRRWGEVAPAWLPFIGGRPVRPKAAIVPATVGSVALMLIWTLGFWDVWTGHQAHRMASPFWATVFAGCYAPLNLWGPALLTLTWAYHRRRARSVSMELGRRQSGRQHGLGWHCCVGRRQQQRHFPDDRHAVGFILGTGWLPVSA
jgi:hypothetical protein